MAIPANRKIVVAAALAVIVLAVVIIAAGGRPKAPVTVATPTPTPVADVKVSITAAGFSPTPAEVTQNHAVVWTNNDTKPHKVTAVQAAPYIAASSLDQPNSPELAPGETYRLVFSHTQSVGYFDGDHPELKGVITVRP